MVQRAGWAAIWSPIGDLVEAVHKRWSPRQPQDIEVLVDANSSTVSVPGFRALVKSSGANLGGERAGWRGFGPGVGLPVALSTGRKGRITSTSLRRWRVDGAKAELGPASLRCALRKASAKIDAALEACLERAEAEAAEHGARCAVCHIMWWDELHARLGA